ncbi:preprotein translocase subunit SecE [Candidatus Dojkabacteria bacterium]|jgi:preprotein translocase SecE subunit|uniref:Protein translocase subunit SecE n=1 Tax=Candidatus Dojkabacteria bacterium TaxID=2099670 RepID=A0A955I7X7_9BACT|nr:preprotein translocase subunit SecE [Candidatus Dojkabacteria bacterium]
MKAVIQLPKRIFSFVRGIFLELKLVEFPTRSKTLRNTHIVIVISILFSVALLLLDGLFNYARNYLTLNI